MVDDNAMMMELEGSFKLWKSLRVSSVSQSDARQGKGRAGQGRAEHYSTLVVLAPGDKAGKKRRYMYVCRKRKRDDQFRLAAIRSLTLLAP